MLGDLRVDLRRGTFVTAHIIRDFKGVDPVRYHAAVRLQAESVPLNVAKNTATRASETAPTGLLIVVWIVETLKGHQMQRKF